MANCEWSLTCTGHNLPKLLRFGARRTENDQGNGRNGRHGSLWLSSGKSLSKLLAFKGPYCCLMTLSNY